MLSCRDKTRYGSATSARLTWRKTGRSGAPGGPILGRLLARLLVDPGRRVDVSELVDAVWGDRGATRSQSTLDSHLHRLRRFLEPGRGRGQATGILILEAGGYRLALAGEQADSVQLRRAGHPGRRAARGRGRGPGTGPGAGGPGAVAGPAAVPLE